jgi:hypothetical protein
MFENELLDLDTFIALRKVAPKVTGVSYGHALEVVKVLKQVSESSAASNDGEGHTYWQTQLKYVAENSLLDLKVAGRACREFGLTLWRKTDGYHVAWSREQIKILAKYFKV